MDLLIIILVLLVGVVLFGALFEFFSALRDRQLYRTPPGKLVDAGDVLLHFVVMGDAHPGKPTVILDAGVGGNHLDWQLVQPNIAEFAQVVAYDRAGNGWSERGSDPRTPEKIVHELHTALQNAGIEPPYLLVGHSFGGIYVRKFAAAYPETVAGIVLVDSSHPEMVREQDTAAEIKRLRRVEMFKRIGLVRVMLPRILSRTNDLPIDRRQQYLAFNLKDNGTVIREALPIFQSGADVPEEVTVPLVVLSREADDELGGERKWNEYQQKLVALSPDAQHIHTESSSHFIALAEPETVVRVVRDLLEQITQE